MSDYEYHPGPNPEPEPNPERYAPPPQTYLPAVPPAQSPPYPPPLYPPPVQWQQPYAPVVAPKNPGLAAVLSILCPGLGQLVNGEIGLGIAMFFLTALAWGSLLFVIGFFAVPAMYIWSAVEAYNTAKRWNTAHGIVS